ncbi:MAG TPA: GDSL-type esterase/lipase family protein [Gemmatimonadales bacterium]|nr:GDSL-type esterase/lipase family protein [Gemmatimonadales bacterium]
MKLTVGEVRLAWALLVIGAGISYPSASRPGPITLAGIILALMPGTIALATKAGSPRIVDGLEHLLCETRGRLSLLAAVFSAILIGFTFNAYVAFMLSAVFCGVMWSADAAFGSAAWERRLGGWSAAALSTFVGLAMVEVVLAWGPVAQKFGTPAELARWGSRYPRGVWSNNFFRFRSPYEDTRRQPGVRRVIALGDSFTWGSKIASSDSTWPALLEQILTQMPGAPKTEVINTGRGGYATGNEAELLRRIGWQFDPDLVILQWLDNDAYVTVPQFGFVATGEKEEIRLVPPEYRTGWIRNSGILVLLERALTAYFIGVVEFNRKHFAPDSPGWLQEQRDFREIADSAARRCTPALLVVYPYLFPGHWTLETYPEKDIHRMVAEAGRNAGFQVLDLLPTFLAAGKDLKEWWGTAYDSHPGSGAQLLAARTIASYLEQHRLLADSSARQGACSRPVR